MSRRAPLVAWLGRRHPGRLFESNGYQGGIVPLDKEDRMANGMNQGSGQESGSGQHGAADEGMRGDGDGIEFVEWLDEDEVEAIGDLGNELDDPEGWMRERVDYWEQVNARVFPSRNAWLRHRFVSAWRLLKSRERVGSHVQTPVPESEWIRLYDECFGRERVAIEPVCGEG